MEAQGTPNFDDDGNGFKDDVVGWDFVASGDTCCGALSSSDLDSATPDPDPSDYAGHGTEVTGFVTAVTGNGVGIAGAAPVARIMPVRVGWRGPTGSAFVCMSFCAQGVEYAARNGARVLNCSWNSGNVCGLGSALDLAIQTFDAVVVGSAGNGGTNSTTIQYLASRPDCIGVGGVMPSGAKPTASNYGSWVDLAAFYQGPPSTWYNPSTLESSYRVNPSGGTSFAAPQVTAAAALLRAIAPAASAGEIRAALLASARPLADLDPTWGDSLGAGLVNYAAAVRGLGGGWDVVRRARGLTPLAAEERLALLGAQAFEVVLAGGGGAAPGWNPGIAYATSSRDDLLPLRVRGNAGDLLVWGETGSLRAVGLDGSSLPGWPVALPSGSAQPVSASLDGGPGETIFVPHGDDVLVLTPGAGGVSSASLGLPLASLAVAGAGSDSIATFAGVEGGRILHVWRERGGARSGGVSFDLGRVTAPPILGELAAPGAPIAVAAATDSLLPVTRQWIVFVEPGSGIASRVPLDAPPIRFLSMIGFALSGSVEVVAADSLGGIHLVGLAGGVRSVDAGGPLIGEALGADLDGDYQSDLLALRADGTLLAWNRTLSPLAGFPRSFPDPPAEAPLVVDAGGRRSVVIADTVGALWSLPFGSADRPAPWPASRGGASRSGFLGYDRATPVATPHATLTWSWAGAGRGSLCWSGSGLDEGIALRLRADAVATPLWEGGPADGGCARLEGRRGGERIRLELLERAGSWIPVALLSLPREVGLRVGAPTPNPFRTEVRIPWSGGTGGAVLEVFDLAGRKVWEVRVPEGARDVAWEGRTSRGVDAPPGLYVLRVSDPRMNAVRRVVKLR